MIRKSGGNVRFIVKRGTSAKSTTARNDIAPSPYSWLNQSVAGPSGSNGTTLSRCSPLCDRRGLCDVLIVQVTQRLLSLADE